MGLLRNNMNKLSRQSFCIQAALASAGLLQAGQSNIKKKSPKRLLIFQQALGYLSENYFPKKEGKLDILPEYFEEFEAVKNNLTVLSGVSHPGLVGSNHYAVSSYLTGHPPAAFGGSNKISIDQLIIDKLNLNLRQDVLRMCTIDESISYDRQGRKIPNYSDENHCYRDLFTQYSENEISYLKERYERELYFLKNPPASSYVNVNLKNSYELMLENKREAVTKKIKWLDVPKPKTKLNLKEVHNKYELGFRMDNMFALAKEAFVQDQCRIAVIYFPFTNAQWNIDGGKYPWHQLTHHGLRDERLSKLKVMEKAMMDRLAGYIQDFKDTKDGESNLLDSTVMFFGSDMGNANAHSPVNLPLFLAGGPFQTGEHHAYSQTKNKPLCNLYLNLLDHMAVHLDHFGSSDDRLMNFST